MALYKIGSTDIPTEGIAQDLFHIETYIEGLSTFIQECATPMTISIQGDWGSGKTSMMNMIKGKTSDSVYPIWFNTWQFSQFNMGNSLIFSMMEVMLDKLGCEPKTITKVMSGLAGFARKTVKVVTDTVVSGAAADMAEELLAPETVTNYAREILELKDKFQKAVSEKIKRENKNRVVVFVDDLDRLQPEKAVELLEVLKLFLECKDCVFVIAVDYDVVTRGIRKKYGIDVSEAKGKSFFDKIIQLPFKVPVAQYDVKNYVSTSLASMNMAASDTDIDLFVHLIQTSIGLNPRSMKRLFNTYQLLDIITRSSVRGIEEATRRKILFSIICMQMGHEKLYQYLASNPIDIELLEQLGSVETVDECINEILDDENIAENDSKYLNKLKRFVLYFSESIQNDGDNKVSENELANLQGVLKCSAVVSVSEGDSEDNTADWDERYRNRKLVERINEHLSDLGTFKIWLPRKAREGVKISDVSSYLLLFAKEGFDFLLEYYLSRENDGSMKVYLMLTCNTSRKESLFLNTLGENPLNFDARPEIEKRGRIMYCHVIKGTDEEMIEKVSELYRKAYIEMQKWI